WLPGNAEAHLPADIPGDQLIVRRLCTVNTVERLLVVEAGAGIVDVADDRLVEDVALRRLDAHRADQHERAKVARRHARHLGGDPAAEAEADQRGLLETEVTE